MLQCALSRQFRISCVHGDKPNAYHSATFERIIRKSNSLWACPQFASACLLRSPPTGNLMPRTRSCETTLYQEDIMSTGVVKFFNSTKGFGFIQPDDGSKDVFVHISAVERAGLATLNENQRLSFDLERSNNGKTAAVNLKAV